MDFLTILRWDTGLYHSQGGATILYYVHFGMTVIKMFYFIPNSRVVRFRCIVSAIIYYLVHFWCTVFGETACIGLSCSVICDILFDGAATSRESVYNAQFSAGRCKTPLLQSCPSAHNADWLHWLSCYIFTRESSYCFHRVFLAIAILSVHLSVCLSVCSFDRHMGGTR